ncbi:MAG: hypothetical protein K0U78_15395 [Actinomycetia bacterium]|nr:hypothetical protein [Actinomycetes bacterium]
MSKITEQIKDLLSNESLSHSLSKEALERMLAEIKHLNAECENLNIKLKSSRDHNLSLSEKLSSAREGNSKLLAKNNEFEKRVKDLEEREKKCSVIEIRNEFEKQRGDEFCSLTNKIFENRIIRESVTKKYPVKESYVTHPDPNGYGGSSGETHIDVTESETSTLEEK